MADKNIQKITILQKDLPELEKTGKYMFRYRIKHKVENIYSDWSTMYKLSIVDSNLNESSINALINNIKYSLTQLSSGDLIASNNGKIELSWAMPDSIKINKFDVYLKWYDGSSTPSEGTRNATFWSLYPKVVEGTYVDINILENYDWVEIAVTAASYPKFVGTNIDSEPNFIFKTELTKIPIPFDGGDLGGQ